MTKVRKGYIRSHRRAAIYYINQYLKRTITKKKIEKNHFRNASIVFIFSKRKSFFTKMPRRRYILKKRPYAHISNCFFSLIFVGFVVFHIYIRTHYIDRYRYDIIVYIFFINLSVTRSMSKLMVDFTVHQFNRMRNCYVKIKRNAAAQHNPLPVDVDANIENTADNIDQNDSTRNSPNIVQLDHSYVHIEQRRITFPPLWDTFPPIKNKKPKKPFHIKGRRPTA